MTDMRVALTMAGSDSGGGAGIQADLRTFHQFGVFGTSAISAVTAQNTTGVSAIHTVPPDLFRAQIEAVFGDIRPHSGKTGMLATRDHINVVVSCITESRFTDLIVDPVMVATSGDRLLEKDARRAMAENLVPLALIVTPNIPEAEELVGGTLETVDDMVDAGTRLLGLGARAALVKGGHHTGDTIHDVLVEHDGFTVFSETRIPSRNTHGTGCTLSAAITACRARGMSIRESVERARRFVRDAISQAPDIGAGNGPVNHMVTSGTE